MASKDGGHCFDAFDSDWDANPDYKDWGSEEDLDAAGIDDEIVDGETTRSTDSTADPSATTPIGSSDTKMRWRSQGGHQMATHLDAVTRTELCIRYMRSRM